MRFTSIIYLTFLLAFPIFPGVTRLNQGTCEQRLLQEGCDLSRGAAWSPNGAMLAVSTYDGIIVYDSTLERLFILDRPLLYFDIPYRDGELAWSTDNTRLAASAARTPSERLIPYIYVWDIRDRTLLIALNYDSAGVPLDEMVWSPQGNRLLASYHNDELGLPGTFTHFLIWNLATGELVVDKEFSGTDFHQLTWNADGETFTAMQDSLMITFDALTGELADAPPTYIPEHSIISPNGRLRAAVDAWGATVTVDNLNTGEVRNMQTPTLVSQRSLYYWSYIAWKPDSSEVIGFGHATGVPGLFVIWDPKTGDILRQTQLPTVGYLNPEKTHTAILKSDRIRLWDIRSGDLIAEDTIGSG